MKCKKCRTVVVESCAETVVTGHRTMIMESLEVTEDSCGIEKTVWFLDEDKAPQWIKDRVDEKDWMKGRLNCPKCGTRIGSFDFTSGTKCRCTNSVLPSIQLIKTKVDI